LTGMYLYDSIAYACCIFAFRVALAPACPAPIPIRVAAPSLALTGENQAGLG